MTEVSGSFQSPNATVVADTIPKPRVVALDAPWSWLAAGWNDLWSCPGISLTYGAVFAGLAACLLIGLVSIGAHSLFLVLAAGFLLVGPFVAVGLYEASRKLQRGETPTLGGVLMAGFNAQGQLLWFGAMLAFVMMVWVQLAFLLFMLFMGGQGLPPAEEFLSTLLFTPRGLGLLVVGSIVGGIIATLVFAISLVSVPLLLEKRIDMITAASASMDAVKMNVGPLALWAALIAVMMAAGFVTLFVGLIVAFPLIGHATWHAYRDLLPADAT